jgi:hypothetical protein
MARCIKVSSLLFILWCLLITAAGAANVTYWYELRSAAVTGKGYILPYPQPMIEYDGTAQSAYAATLQIATAVCGTLMNELRPSSCGLEVIGGTNGYASCSWYINCSATRESVRMGWDGKNCLEGTYPNPSSTGIVCQSTKPQYCSDGKIYNNVAGTCDLPPPPSIQTKKIKNLGGNLECPSPYVSGNQ